MLLISDTVRGYVWSLRLRGPVVTKTGKYPDSTSDGSGHPSSSSTGLLHTACTLVYFPVDKPNRRDCDSHVYVAGGGATPSHPRGKNVHRREGPSLSWARPWIGQLTRSVESYKNVDNFESQPPLRSQSRLKSLRLRFLRVGIAAIFRSGSE